MVHLLLRHEGAPGPHAATAQPEHGLAETTRKQRRLLCRAPHRAALRVRWEHSVQPLSVLVFDHSQTQKTKAVREDRRTLLILPWELQANTEYEFQVRARPREDTGYHGFWSEWSPLLTLKTSPTGTYCQLPLPCRLVRCQTMLPGL